MCRSCQTGPFAADNKTQELEVKLGLKDVDHSEVLSGVSDSPKLLEPKPVQNNAR